MPQGESVTGIFCRKCGYDLRAQSEPYRCPECGRPFDPANPRTFRRRPPRGFPWRWLRRLAISAVAVALLLGLGWGWLYWDWKQEQLALETMRINWRLTRPLGGRELQSCLGSAGWVLDRVDTLDCPQSTTDGNLARIGKLEDLRHLILFGTHITDASLIYIRELKNLQVLDLLHTQITDAGLVHLRELNSLQDLRLADTRITDAGLVHLAELKHLQLLELNGTRVTPAGIAKLQAALPNTIIVR